jgi:hypothetical protein
MVSWHPPLVENDVPKSKDTRVSYIIKKGRMTGVIRPNKLPRSGLVQQFGYVQNFTRIIFIGRRIFHVSAY